MAIENTDSDTDDLLEYLISDDDQPDSLLSTIGEYINKHERNEAHLMEAQELVNENLVWLRGEVKDELENQNGTPNRLRELVEWYQGFKVLEERILLSLQITRQDSDDSGDTEEDSEVD